MFFYVFMKKKIKFAKNYCQQTTDNSQQYLSLLCAGVRRGNSHFDILNNHLVDKVCCP